MVSQLQNVVPDVRQQSLGPHVNQVEEPVDHHEQRQQERVEPTHDQHRYHQQQQATQDMHAPEGATKKRECVFNCQWC
jgi:hypothetical protein